MEVDAEENSGSFEYFAKIQPSVRRLDPFWATRLWQKLTREALTKVRVCRQRHFLKNYDEVFNGEDLVTVVNQFLKECKDELDVNRIGRANAVKVCQVLMEKKFFECVFPKGMTKFEDNSHRFYRFVDDKISQETLKNNEEQSNLKISNSVLSEEKENVVLSPYNRNSSSFTPNFVRSVTRHSIRLKAPLLKVRDTRPSPVRLSKRNSRCSGSIDDGVTFRETALALLLQLVDVPVLESILSVPYDLPELPEAPQPFVLENDFTPRKIKPAKVDFTGPVADIPWVKAASACLGGLHPAGITGLWSLQACKVLCYKSVVDRFSCSAESLIPGEYISICVSIVKMLKTDRRAKALFALQLLMHHLPLKRCQQLRNLLEFLHLVVNDIFVSIDKKVTNYEAAYRDFLSVVFKHPLVSEEPQKILFDYLLLKSQSVFQMPVDLKSIKVAGPKFCRTIPEEDFVASSAKLTEKSLYELALHVVDSTNIKLAEKKVWMKKLKKHHNKTYEAFNFYE